MSSFIFVLGCLYSLSIPVFSQCPNNWIRNEGSCYHFSHDLENWPDSMVICNAVKAFLVEINSENENDFILNNANASSYWIGLSDLEEGTWKWMHSQTDPTFTKWAATEPNNAGQNENCAILFGGVKNIEERGENAASSYWIGLSDLEEEGTWKWMHSQTDPTFTKWAATEPNNAGQNENCAMIRKKEKDWNDYVCQNGMHYICGKHLEDIEAVG